MSDGIKKISENVIVDNRALIVTNPNEKDNRAISIGAIKTDASNKGMKIKTSDNTYSLFDADKILLAGSINTALLANYCVTEIKIADNAVVTRTIKNSAVTEPKLATNSVTTEKVKNLAITDIKIADKNIKTRHYDDLSILNIAIANNTIMNEKIFDKTISNKKIADNTIINSLMATNSIGTTNLIDQSVTNSKIADENIYGNKIKRLSIENRHLSLDSVNTQNILNGAITSPKILEKNIKSIHIDNNQITNMHLINGVVTEPKLADDSVSTVKIRNNNVTKTKLSTDIVNVIDKAVVYDQNDNVQLKKDLNVAGNIEAVGTISANRILNAVFMDLAEAYIPSDSETFVPGDIVEVREDGKLYRSSSVTDNKTIVGVVSDEYAACYGATEEEIINGEKIPVGLIGKVHVNVSGPINIGEYIGASKDGVGVSTELDFTLKSNQIVGKALESKKDNSPGKVLCLIFPN